MAYGQGQCANFSVIQGLYDLYFIFCYYLEILQITFELGVLHFHCTLGPINYEGTSEYRKSVTWLLFCPLTERSKVIWGCDHCWRCLRDREVTPFSGSMIGSEMSMWPSLGQGDLKVISWKSSLLLASIDTKPVFLDHYMVCTATNSSLPDIRGVSLTRSWKDMESAWLLHNPVSLLGNPQPT